MNSIVNSRAINYEKRIFAFIDILGFSYLIEESTKDSAKIIDIYNLLEDAKAMINLPIGHKFKHLDVDLAKYVIHFFSDTITMSCPFESFDYFNAMVGWLWHYQSLIWTKHKMFLRGAIVYGDIYDNAATSIVFGPAMVDAYTLERKRAKWPRILIGDSVFGELSRQEKQRVMKEIVRKDKGGTYYYLDYLHDLFCLSSGRIEKQDKMIPSSIMLLNNHKIAIQEAVKRIQTDTMIGEQKKNTLIKRYKRLAKYHNSVIDKFCQVSLKLINDNRLMREINIGVLSHGLLRSYGLAQKYNIKPTYSADNLKYIDIMPILAIVVSMIDRIHSDIDEIVCIEMPKCLSELLNELHSAKISDSCE